ncbi:MAG TPA: carboxylesterase/lipase family protein [Caulobacteraceae bacterium]|jgi:para-nitrobenzyl esterase
MTEILERAELTDPVTTTHGPVRGYRDHGLSIFKGLRYAAPPIAALRFQPPEAPTAWREPAEALGLGAPAIQAAVPPGETTGGRGAGDPPAPGQPGTSEDCLFLNVWTPGAGGERPVMVWLHGGGFGAGSGGAAMYDGAALARRGDVVTVTVNHRLGVFGYLNLAALGGHPSSGVAGMLDIVAALKWVRDNIARFGGDPANVTLFGESGGGWKVSLLMAMPGAKGLFHRAIVQSGPGLRAHTAERAEEQARALMAKLGASDIAQLDNLPVTDIHAAAAAVTGPDIARGFAPSLDGIALPRHPFDPRAPEESAAIPLMIGTNKDEATLFLYSDPRFGEFTEEDVRKRAEAVAGDRAQALIEAVRTLFPDYSPSHLVAAIQTLGMFWCDSIRLAERKAAQQGAPAYLYRLDWETPVARGALKSPHALEIPLVFDNVEAARSFVGRGEEPQRMADLMAPAWLAFARTGDPSTPDLPPWPAYETERRATMVFDLEPRMELDSWADIRRLLISGT